MGRDNYTYDPLNRRTQKNLLSAVTQRSGYTYDLASQLQQVLNNVVSGPVISQYDYTYDQVSNRLTMATSGAPGVQSFNYAYDNIDQLTAVSGSQSHSYVYDKVHNRTGADGVTYTSNNLHQYTSVAGITYAHDSNGNLTSDGITTYTYDEENRLTTAVKTGLTASYTYDAFNRRVSKTVNGVITYFVYDDEDIIEDRNSGGSLIADYVHGSDIDEVLTMTRGSNTYYYHHDGLGSVTEITNSTGTIVENYSYDVYGQPSILTSSISNRYRFTGREFDEETGLYHYRNRTYSPTLGRFLQRDPIGYYDSMNLYQYVKNNSVNWTDPLGLEKVGEYDVEWHSNHHGGDHWQIFDKQGNTIGRFKKDGTPIPHKGKIPKMPGAVRKFLKRGGLLLGGAGAILDLSSGKSLGDTAGNALDPFAPDDLSRDEDIDDNHNGVPDMFENPEQSGEKDNPENPQGEDEDICNEKN